MAITALTPLAGQAQEISLTDKFRDAMDEIQRFRDSPNNVCNGPEAKKASTSIDQVLIAGLSSATESINAGRTHPNQALKVTFNALGRLDLNLAEAALKKNCLDLADKHYRRVLSYDSPGLGPLKESAKIGIDDVRHARRGK